MKKQLIDRKDVDVQRTWDLQGLYAAEEDFNRDVVNLEEMVGKLVLTYKGKLKDADTINRCLDDLRKVYQLYHLTSSFAHLAMTVDMTDHAAIARRSKNAIAMSKMEAKLSFVNSEILEQDWTVIREAMEASAANSHYLADLLRFKPYVLHPEVERVLSALSGTIDAPYNIYNRAKLADMDFGTFKVGEKEYPLSFVLFENEWEFEQDPEVRRAAFDAFSDKLREYQNTVAAVYETQVQTEKTISDLRGYESVIDSLLFDQKVERELYDRQIDVIFEKLAPHMRRYADLIRRVHKMDEMRFSDLKLVVDPDFEPSITVAESKRYILDGLSILGPDYSAMLERAFDERWIDFVQNKGKSTGAFCSSPYGSHPFILISWTERMREVFVLAHELGHAGHFYLAQKNQNVFDT
ncbi:MAG TPA: M3 family metallopeptidase, partial [Clostridiaceae bacterium]|nr:M3 family metallopeptidase [Clostridiaceae bacterium]